MKKKILIYGSALFLLAGTFIASSGGRIQDARTSSPLDGQNCTSCHASIAITATGWITTNIPAEGYTPGETYTITATGTHTGVGKMGFQLTAETTLAKTGTFTITDTDRTQLTNSGDAVTHTSLGHVVSGNSNNWSMDWTAPTAGTGSVGFYAAFNAANGNGTNDDGDQIYLENIQVNEMTVGTNQLSKTEISFHPNPASNYISINSTSMTKSVKFYNNSGKLLKTVTNSGFDKVDISELPSGNYIMIISTEKSSVSKKLIIQ